MIVAKRTYDNKSKYSSLPIFPATFDNGKLVIGHNKHSIQDQKMRLYYDKYKEYYNEDNFSFFTNINYYKQKKKTPQFLFVGTVPYELISVYSATKKFLYSYLRPCKPNTYFCKCDNCGEHFVLTYMDCEYYEKFENYVLPTIRCKTCIEKFHKYYGKEYV